MPLGLLRRTWGGNLCSLWLFRTWVGLEPEEQLLGILIVPVLIALWSYLVVSLLREPFDQHPLPSLLQVGWTMGRLQFGLGPVVCSCPVEFWNGEETCAECHCRLVELELCNLDSQASVLFLPHSCCFCCWVQVHLASFLGC